MKLNELKRGEQAVVAAVEGEPAFRERLMAMGFLQGERVEMVRRAPMGDPVIYRIMGYEVSLRRHEAEMVSCQPSTADGKHDEENLVVFIGNPNSGKTSLFNAAAHAHERTGNYCGVTVDIKTARLTHAGHTLQLVDLPGTYSISSTTAEERYVRDYLREHRPSLLVNVVDATNLQRNLFLTRQLAALGLPMVVALNMYDEVERSGDKIDVEALGARLGVPVVPTVGRTGEGVAQLFDYVNLGGGLRARVRCGCCAGSSACPLDDIVRRSPKPHNRLTHRIDAFVTHPLLGFPIFLALMWFTFFATFTLGQYPMDAIDAGIAALADALHAGLPAGWLTDLLADGIVAGVGAVLAFLPNILILYLFLSLFEDSGYMARAAFIMDRLMHALGLHGKSFIPMVMGFGCNIPAVMAARTIDERRARLATQLVVPLMSCSARLPVFILIAGAFFPNYATEVVFGLYVLGIVLALAVAKVLSLCLRGGQSPFVMELPPYRLPLARSVGRHIWEKGRAYLHKMGTVVLAASMAVWALSYFPHHAELPLSVQMEQSLMGQIGKAIAPVLRPCGLGWQEGVSLIAGVGAKEIVVATMNILGGTATLRAASALAFLVFVLLYMPCIPTCITISHEAGSRRWGLFAALYTTALAYIASLITYHIALLCRLA